MDDMTKRTEHINYDFYGIDYNFTASLSKVYESIVSN